MSEASEVRRKLEAFKAEAAQRKGRYQEVLEELKRLDEERKRLFYAIQDDDTTARKLQTELQEALLKEQNAPNLDNIGSYLEALKSHRRYNDILPFQHEDLAFMFDRWTKAHGLAESSATVHQS